VWSLRNASWYKNINSRVNENVALEFMDDFDSRPRWKRLCSRCDDYGFDRKRLKGFRNGEHGVMIRTVDRAGNADVEVISFEVA